MITFFTGKHKRPEPSELVGRLVGKYGMADHADFSLPILVTGATATKLDGRIPVFSLTEIYPVSEWKEQIRFDIKKVGYACDTLEEAALIRETCRKAEEEWNESRKAARNRISTFFHEIDTTEDAPAAQASVTAASTKED